MRLKTCQPDVGLIEHVHFFCIFLLHGLFLFLIHLLLTNSTLEISVLVKSGKVYHPPTKIFAVISSADPDLESQDTECTRAPRELNYCYAETYS